MKIWLKLPYQPQHETTLDQTKGEVTSGKLNPSGVCAWYEGLPAWVSLDQLLQDWEKKSPSEQKAVYQDLAADTRLARCIADDNRNKLIYIHKDNEQKGPLEKDVIVACLKGGVFSNSDLVWQEGMTEWIPLVDFLLNHASKASPARVMPPPIPHSNGSNLSTNSNESYAERLPRNIQTKGSSVETETRNYNDLEGNSVKELFIIGRCITPMNDGGIVPSRNLDVINSETGRVIFSFEEVRSNAVTYIAKSYVYSSHHMPYNVNVTRNGRSFGTLKGHHSCTLYDVNGKTLATVRQKATFNSVYMIKRHLFSVLSLIVLIAFIIAYPIHVTMHAASSKAALNPFLWMGSALVLGLVAQYVGTRRSYKAYDKGLKPQYFILLKNRSKNTFTFYDAKNQATDLQRVTEEEVIAKTGKRAADYDVSDEMKQELARYAKTDVKSMNLRDKFSLMTDIRNTAREESIRNMRSMNSSETTHRRVVTFTEPINDENAAIVSMVAYLIFVSYDCD